MLSLMPSDAELATLACVDIYSHSILTDARFDHVDVGMDDGVFWALKKLPGFDVVVLRGSVIRLDWQRDFRAMATPTGIGHVHAGFWAGMTQMWDEAKLRLSQPVIVTGHSLGAARAAVLTGLMIADGTPPVARVVFGEPKPGLMDLAKFIEGVPGRSYRNGDEMHHDLVTDVPLSFPPWQYVHPTPVIPVCCLPNPDEFGLDGVFAWHHGALYETALHVLGGAAAA
jgi:hypothetical protein